MSRSTSSSSTDAASVPDGFLEIGHVRRAHGLRGEVFVQLTSNLDERLDPGSSLVTAGGETLLVESSRTASNGRRVVKFDRLADRTAAERYANVALYGAPIERDDALWAHELVGCEVLETDGTARGRCVSLVANPAADLLELQDGTLVPSNFIVSIDDGVVVVEVPDGLFDA
jgi:16S rRNA processing protein RimM